MSETEKKDCRTLFIYLFGLPTGYRPYKIMVTHYTVTLFCIGYQFFAVTKPTIGDHCQLRMLNLNIHLAETHESM